MSTAFVLSGGGSLGAVQIGMLQALAEQGIEPDLLVGTSAGAINALWVAEHGMSLGSLAELGRIWTQVRRRDIFPVRPIRAVRAFVGRTSALSSSESLGELIRAHSTVSDLAATSTPVHLMTTDLLIGTAFSISTGSPSEGVRASAAIPGVFAPIRVGDRWLIDGAMAFPSGITHAVVLGATKVYVLPTGTPCALARPPRSALGVAVHALTLLLEQRLITEISQARPGITINLLPPLCPVTTSAADFSHGSELIDRTHRASVNWIEGGGFKAPQPERYLALHDHRETASARPGY